MAWLARLTDRLTRATGTRRVPTRALFEELEPRLLYSADSPLALSAAAPVPVAVVEVSADDERAPAQTPMAVAEAQAAPAELVFIDSGVAGWEDLLAEIQTQRGDLPVIVVDASRDGIDQIGEVLAQHRDLRAVHLISHGSDGVLQVGATTLSEQTLSAHAPQIAAWREALAPDADLLLYGCELAAGGRGAALMAAFHELTGADVAASIDATGHSEAGGNWVLERSLGRIESAVVIDAQAAMRWGGLLATYTVTNTSDTADPGSLRWAITQANLTVELDTIAFQIGEGGPQKIALASQLPQVTRAVIIDGSTQVGYSGTPLIEVDGSRIGASVKGLHISAGNSTVKGLVLGGFNEAIYLNTVGGNTIVGNYIGTDASGTVANRNYQAIAINSIGNNTIGGLTAAERNVIGGSTYGISLQGNIHGNVIRGNYIGTDAQGSAAIANNYGISVLAFNLSQQVAIGGTAAGAGNLISGNSLYGITVFGGQVAIQGNTIGLDASGSAPIGNGTGVAAMGGSVLVGGTGAGAGNRIAGNLGAGVQNMLGTGFQALGNAIHSNGGLGITSTAASARQFPVLSLARTDPVAGTVQIAGQLTATPSSHYRIEFFASASQDSSGYGEGARYLGHLNVTTAANGTVSVGTTLTAPVADGEYITATATGSDAGFSTFTLTSEFGRSIAALPTGQAAVTVDTASDVQDGDTTTLSTLLANKGADGSISLREAIIAANNTAGTDTIRFQIGAGGPQTIAPGSALPTITDALVIDGTTQGGHAGTPLIELDGRSAGASDVHGLLIQAGNSTVRGLVIGGFSGDGIAIQVKGGNTIEGNYLGTDATGTAANGNKQGVSIFNTGNNTIGGLAPAQRNVISGNSLSGVRIHGKTTGPGIDGNVVRGNYIGTTADGTVGLGNQQSGISLYGESAEHLVTIGGSDDDAGNLISGNQYGIHQWGGSAVVRGNIIGLDASETYAVANTTGIHIVNGPGTVTIGGTAAGEGNTIAGNTQAGVMDATAGKVSILGNTFRANGGLGIDTFGDGVSANWEAGHAAAARNFPVLTLARTGGAQLTIEGTLNAAASSHYRIEFFANATPDDSGHGEGERYLGHVDVSTDAAGQASFSKTLDAAPGVGEFVSATATRTDADYSSYGATSEFSRNVAVLPAAGLAQVTVDTAADVADGDTTSLSTLLANKGADGRISLREALIAANATAGRDTIRFQIGAGGAQSIVVASALPLITDPVVIDGTTQGGYAGAPLIELDGRVLGRTAHGLSIVAGSSTVRGLVIGGFDAGIYLSSNGGNTIVGNYIGTDAAGLAANGNSKGIAVHDAGNNTIGGVTAALRNVIAGNISEGIHLNGSSTPGIDGNVILGNYIGTDASGRRALGNGFGIWTQTVGSTSQVTIGGTEVGAGNLISGNNNGIGASGGQVLVQGNVIGMDKDDILALPNAIGIINFGGGTVAVGGTADGAGNRIAGNLGAGIVDVAGTGFYALGNSIESNGGLGIDTFGDGVTQNSALGARNFPILTGISTDTEAGLVRIEASLYGATSTYYRLEFFASAQRDETGHGEGGRYIGYLDVLTLSKSGAAHLDTWIAADVAPGEFISATATRIANPALQTFEATSEFAWSVVAVRAQGEVVTVDTAADNADGDYTSMSRLLADKGPDGRISLREAIYAAGATDGTETIRFQIGAGGLQTIFLTGALPSIGTTMVIDGTTQGGYSGTPLIQLDGRALDVGWKGLRLTGADTVVRGLIFSGFLDDAIYVQGGGVVLTGNYIGTDASGLAADGGNRGIVVSAGDAASTVVIGGTQAGEGNVISGNNKGIHVVGGPVLIQGNIIGLDATTTAAIPNGTGISVLGGTVAIGGIAAGAGNTVAGNTGAAIVDYNGRTVILGNSIHSNGGLGFDYLEDGVTLNAASGPAATRNFPVLTLGRTEGDTQQLTIAGVLTAAADTPYRIEFYANGSQDATGYGEGARYLGYANVTTDAAGQASIAVVLDALAAEGEFLSATATRSNATFSIFAATSEFARNIVALPAAQAQVTVDTTADRVDGDTTSLSTLLANKGADGFISLREAIEAANGTPNGASPDRIVFGIPLTDANHLYYRDDGIAGSFGAAVTTALNDAAIGDFDADHPAGLARSWYRISLTHGEIGIDDAVIIDGSTQTGYAAVAGPVIEIDASGVPGNALRLAGGASTLRGLAINGAPGAGIQVDASGAGSRIVGNVLGTDILGMRMVPNGVNIRVAGDRVTIGGTVDADHNLIAGATGAGVGVEGGASGVRILGNAIHGNDGLGIDLGLNGVTANDDGDADAGPNGLLNFPVLESAAVIGGQIRIDGVAYGRPGETLRVELYASDAADASGHGQGERYLGFVDVVAGADGRAAIAALLVAAVRAGEAISATATDSDGNTSEFAASIEAASPAVIVTPVSGLVTTEGGGTATFSVVLATRPTADVVIDIASSDVGEATVSVARLTFRANDWRSAQTVTLTGVQDDVNDGDTPYAVLVGPVASGDVGYDGLDPADVAAVNAQVPNTPPVHTLPGSQATDEDTPLVFSAAHGNAIVITDADAGTQTVQVTLTATAGVLTLARLDGLSFSAGTGIGEPTMTMSGSLAALNAALDGLVFTPNADAHGAAGLTVVTSDLGNTGTGGARSRWDGIDITINPVNDAPIRVAHGGLTLDEGGSATIDAATLHASDVDHGAAQLVYVLGAGVPAHGTLLLDGAALGAGDSFTQDDIDQGRLSYAHDGSETRTDGFDFELTDGSSSLASQRFAITIAPVNDAPELSAASGGLLQADAQGVLRTLGASITDADSPLLAEATVRITGGYRAGVDLLSLAPVHGLSAHWNPAEGALALRGLATAQAYAAALDDVRYTTTGSGADARVLSLSVSDGQAWSAVLTQSLVLADPVGAVPEAPAEPVTIPEPGATPAPAPASGPGPGPIAVPVDVSLPAKASDPPAAPAASPPAPSPARPPEAGPAVPSDARPAMPADAPAEPGRGEPVLAAVIPMDAPATAEQAASPMQPLVSAVSDVRGAGRSGSMLTGVAWLPADYSPAAAILAASDAAAAAARAAAMSLDSWHIPVFQELDDALPWALGAREGSSSAISAPGPAAPILLDLESGDAPSIGEGPALSLLSETTVGSGLVLSAGVIWWATRSGSLLAAMMTSVPAWRSFDPLPILARERTDNRDADDAEQDDASARSNRPDGTWPIQPGALPMPASRGAGRLVIDEMGDLS